jgi:hypothetical protein
MGPPAAALASRTQSSKNVSVWQGFRLMTPSREGAISVAQLARFWRGLDRYSIRNGFPYDLKKYQRKCAC